MASSSSHSQPVLIHDQQFAESDDAFLEFVDYAVTLVAPQELNDPDGGGEDGEATSWSWIVCRILKTCIGYSSGVTAAILLSDIFQAWNEQRRIGASRRRAGAIDLLRKKYRRSRLQDTVAIDSIYEKNFLSTNSVLEVVVLDVVTLPGTNIYVLKLGDHWSSNTIDLYLHRRYYDIVQCDYGILKKGREIFLTGCCLRSASEGSGCLRLLPTEYLVILLDEDADEDAMLLGAQFCSETFSSISLDAVNNGASYSFYARIESVGSPEDHGQCHSVKRREVTLVDNDGVKIKFFLWGDQVILANVFSVGSMLALDKPFVANAVDSNMETSEQICLEYGSATQLYLVPFIQHKEQLFVAPTQNRLGSRLLGPKDQTQDLKVSQVALPCDSQGSVDFRNYPFRMFVADLHDKMTSVSLYGVVVDMFRETNTTEAVFSLTIEDATGAVVVKLHFVQSWSLGRLSIGHTIYITGLTCSMKKQKQLELTWFEKEVGASLIDLSGLPAMLNSSCLHKLSYLSDLSCQSNITYICSVRLGEIDYHHLTSRFFHAVCGQLVNERSNGFVMCNFCHCTCEDEMIRAFHLELTLSDETDSIFAWCIGQTAAELLQISTDEFFELPEDEQSMYLFTLKDEKFMVAIVNSKKRTDVIDHSSQEDDSLQWEIVRALKNE
ncbi:hypothetical protein H6P81_002363 [Aristolochia fimbriata]|uniref:Nucleic acid-binding protein n=1 Tax=Aristolochia fimbriata TaxID=158543 RepID=A0AAV7FCF1_ARIFI|nr:hypothetical protein H6P81_002363 [Aristolochia fimbriata]